MAKYIKESFKELSRVSWPNFNTTVRLTVIVLLFSVLSAITVGAVDYVLSTGYQQVVNYTIQSGIRNDQRTSHTPQATDTPAIEATTGDATFSVQGVEASTSDGTSVEVDTTTTTEVPAN